MLYALCDMCVVTEQVHRMADDGRCTDFQYRTSTGCWDDEKQQAAMWFHIGVRSTLSLDPCNKYHRVLVTRLDSEMVGVPGAHAGLLSSLGKFAQAPIVVEIECSWALTRSYCLAAAPLRPFRHAYIDEHAPQTGGLLAGACMRPGAELAVHGYRESRYALVQAGMASHYRRRGARGGPACHPVPAA